MRATISLDSLWQTIQSMPTDKEMWLLEKLQNSLLCQTVEEDSTKYISKQEILTGIDAGLKDLKAGRKQSFDDFIKEMENEIQD